MLFAVARSPRLRSMTNFFLANLAVADLCVGVFCVIPNLSTYLSPTWILGRVTIDNTIKIVNTVDERR